MEQLILGFLAGCWVFTVGGGVYAAWKYVYTPWKVVRADQKALNDRLTVLLTELEEFKAEMGKRKAISFTPEQIAGMERAQRMKLLQGAMERGLDI